MINAEKYMQKAIDLAKIAESNGDVPIGCIIVHNDEIIGEGYNRVEIDKNSTKHAEMIAIDQAVNNIGYKHLLDCTLFVNLEPCSMCAGAIVLSRIPNVYIGTKDPKTGAGGSLINILNNEKLNHRCLVDFGILEQECSQMIKSFFRKLRDKND